MSLVLRLRPQLINYVSIHTLLPSSELLPNQEGQFKSNVENLHYHIFINN